MINNAGTTFNDRTFIDDTTLNNGSVVYTTQMKHSPLNQQPNTNKKKQIQLNIKTLNDKSGGNPNLAIMNMTNGILKPK